VGLENVTAASAAANDPRYAGPRSIKKFLKNDPTGPPCIVVELGHQAALRSPKNKQDSSDSARFVRRLRRKGKKSNFVFEEKLRLAARDAKFLHLTAVSITFQGNGLSVYSAEGAEARSQWNAKSERTKSCLRSSRISRARAGIQNCSVGLDALGQGPCRASPPPADSPKGHMGPPARRSSGHKC